MKSAAVSRWPMLPISMAFLVVAWVMIPFDGTARAFAADPVALRVESFTVPPSTGPLAFVEVRNLLDKPYQGSVSMKGPEGWRIAPPSRQVTLTPGETKRVPFTIEKGRNVAVNIYRVEVSAVGAGSEVIRRQDVFCASAPYFKPTIDGDRSDWKDAIPVTFATGGKLTAVSTFWNRRGFSLLVAVEEAKLVRRDVKNGKPFDAVQVAISSAESRTGTSPDEAAARFEFLLVAGEGDSADCFQLARPDMKLSETAADRELGPLSYEDATVAVRRVDGVTYYECNLPFRPMRDEITPSEGREFYFSVLVHDPDGVGIRDLAVAAGLDSSRRNALAWSRWRGADWGQVVPLDNKLQWGMCTSKY